MKLGQHIENTNYYYITLEMRFHAQPCMAAFSCLITALVPVNGFPMQLQGILAVPDSGSPAAIPEPRILGTLLPRSPVDYSLVCISPSEYPTHTASGIESQSDPGSRSQWI